MRCISTSKMAGSVYASRRTRSGSTILLSSSMGLSYVVFEVAAHLAEDLLQRLDLGSRQAGQRQVVEPLHFGPDALEHLPAGGGQRQARDAHVLLVRQALDTAGILHAGDGGGERGAVDGAELREVRERRRL